MVRVYDVDAGTLIKKTAERLKGDNIEKPAFVGLVKSGAHAQRPPENPEFWFIRCASLLRQAYVNGKVGVNRMRRHYGGRKSRGAKPEKHNPAGGSTVRKAFHALEKAGYMEKEKTGRVLTPKGRALLDKVASEL